jgi:DNA-binding MarR family transcriptional regulator
VDGLGERDRRERIYELTPAGRRELSGLTPRWELAQQRLRKALGASAWKQMQSGLGEIAEAARRA